MRSMVDGAPRPTVRTERPLHHASSRRGSPPHSGWDFMIIGIGSDLCNIERIRNSLDRFGE